MFSPMDCRFAIQTFMVAGILSSHQVEAPEQRCDKNTEYPHADKCCKLCPAGTYVVNVCEQNHDISTCEECPPNTFAAVDNNLSQCHRCSNPCDEQWEGIQISNCTPYHNRECRCKKGMHRHFDICKRHTPCPAGQGVLRKGSYRSDTRCQPCPAGTFSKRSSIFEKCKPWTNCAVLGLKTREEGNASRDAKCGDRVQPQEPTPTSNPAHNTSAMDTPTAAATVPQNSSHMHEEANTSAATVTLASTTIGSVAVTSTPTTSQSPPDSGESMTTADTSPSEDRNPGPDGQPTIAVSDVVIIVISAVILVLLIIMAVWHYYKEEEREKIAGANGPPIEDIPPNHQQLPNEPDEGGDFNQQDLQEQQALLPRMEHGEGELEPEAMEPARGGEQNQQEVQIFVPTGTGTPGGQINIQGVYQDQRCVFDARNQTVQLQLHNPTVHQHFSIESPEFVQIGPNNTINQNTADATNQEATNSEASEPGE